MSTALIIIDIQNDYFENGANALVGSEEASLHAKMILSHFRGNKDLIVHIQHLSTRPGSTFFIPETEGCLIHENVAPLVDEKVIIKHYPNSFRETELLSFLREREISHLVICGMMTHMCIDATTRAAKDFGFDCTLIGDACASKNLEINGNTVFANDVHHSFLAALNYFYAKVMTTQAYLDVNK